MNNDENQFYRLIESSPDAIFISGQGRFVYANPAAIQLFGATSQGQLRGQYVIERIHPEFRAVIAERIRLMHEQGKTAPLLEQKYLRLDGTSVDVEVTAVPFLYAGEECGLVFVRNITQRKSAEDELRQHQQLLQSIIDNSPAVIFVKDLEGHYLRTNRRFADLFHINNESVLGLTDFDHFPTSVANAVRASDQQVLSANMALEFDEVVPHDDGPHTYISLKFPLRDNAGQPYAICGIATDITERKRAEQESMALFHRYQTLMKTSLDGIHIMDIDGNVLEANDSFCHMLGYTQEEMARLNASDWDAKLTKEELREDFRKVIGKSALVRTLHRRKDGVLLDVEISATNIMLDGRYCIFASSRDVTERNRIQHDLLQTSRQLRELVAKFESSQEAERKSIAREVHDELGQTLSTLRLDISMIRTRFGKNNPELMALAENMTELVDHAIHGVRNVSENLRPAVMGMGIYAAIDWLCSNFAARTGIPCVLGSPDPCVDMEETRAVVIFRIVQESLTNVMRHAHARNVNIVISRNDEYLCVEVKDDGRGFDMNNSKQQASFGLLGMRERARAWGGHLDIASTQDKGTVISFCIPIIGTGENK